MSSNQKFLNIMNQFNSNQKEVEKDKEIEDKNKFSNDKNKKEDYFSPNKEYNKISESQKEQSLYKNDDKLSQNSKNQNNKENNSLKNNLEDIPLYSDREIIEIVGKNQNNAQDTIKDNIKDSLNNNINNITNNYEKELLHLYSFNPKTPNSPEFNKKNFDFENNKEENNLNKTNYKLNYSSNKEYCTNFSEKINAKIENEDTNNKPSKKNKTVDNIIKGKKKNELKNLDKIINNNNDNEFNTHKDSDSEEIEKQKEDEFLKEVDLKIQNQKKEEENGKENVTDDDDNNDINFNINSNNFEKNKFTRNRENKNIIISETEGNKNKLEDIKIKDYNLQNIQKNFKNEDNKFSDGIEKRNNNNIINNKFIKNGDKNNIFGNDSINKEKKEVFNSPNKNITKMIYKKTSIKNNKKINPSPNKNKINTKNTINNNANNNINTSYFNSENKVPNISQFSICTYKSNTNGQKSINEEKDLINQEDLKNIKKKLYIPEDKPKQTEQKKTKTRKNKTRILVTPIKSRTKEKKIKQEKHNFTPEINKKSEAIWEKRNKRVEENIISPEKDNYYLNSSRKNKLPVYELLTEVGNNMKKKLETKLRKKNEEIKSNANIKKINDNSYNMAKNRINKTIDKIINEYIKDTNDKINEDLSIITMIQCLCSMRIINELIKTDQITELTLDILQEAIKNIKNSDNKKYEELEFIEQLWFILNPSSEESINYKLFSDTIKILFESNYSEIKKFCDEFKKNLKGNGIDYEIQKRELYISPLREVNYEPNDIWSISKLIKSFLKLKSDIKGYKNNYSELKKEKLKYKLIEKTEKELPFKPNLKKVNYNFTNPKFELYKQNLDDDNKTETHNTHSKKNDFNKVYERFMKEEKNKKQVLEKMREIENSKKQKKYTLIPKINEDRPSYLNDRLNKSVDLEIPVYERLYNLRKINNKKKIKLEENEQLGSKFNSKRSFKNVNNNDNININLKNRNGGKNRVIKLKQDKNYQQYAIKNKDRNNININNNDNKNKQINKVYEKKISKMHYKISRIHDNNLIDNIYIGMEIKTPKGGKKPIRIYKNQANISDVVEDFCKQNDISNKDKKFIVNQVIYFRKNIFGRNISESYNSRLYSENKLISENMDTNTNTSEI